MVSETGKVFNILEQRPKVLLVGNGPVIMSGNAIPWETLIEKLGDKKNIIPEDSKIPYSLQATVAASDVDGVRRKKYEEVFSDYEYKENPCIKKLLEYSWDAVLTTNYTYDFEYSCNSAFVGIKDKSRSKYVYTTQKDGSKTLKGYGHILTRNFNRFETEFGTKDIWHVHGEIRNKSSIVLTHDEYARQTRAILQYLSDRKNEYADFSDHICFKSWIDYLVLGDLYIVGLGMDFSEFDLWWLLNRRLREQTGKGKITFFAPRNEDKDIFDAIELLGGKCESFGQSLIGVKRGERDVIYNKFYEMLWSYLDKNIL